MQAHDIYRIRGKLLSVMLGVKETRGLIDRTDSHPELVEQFDRMHDQMMDIFDALKLEQAE